VGGSDHVDEWYRPRDWGVQTMLVGGSDHVDEWYRPRDWGVQTQCWWVVQTM
jgi:hypothetical protein